MDLPLTREDVYAASARIAPWVRETPVIRVGTEIGGLAAPDVLLKLESFQVSGAFKARGAFNALLAEAVPPAGVVAVSGGNHAAAVAYAAKRLGVRAEAFVPRYASPVKIARLAEFGAALRLFEDYPAAQRAALARCAETGARLVHPFDDPLVVGGQGTLALELEAQAGACPLDTVIVSVGGGGLLGGLLAALEEGPTRVVAVESTGTASLHAALAAGQPVDVPVSGLAADALGAPRVGSIGFALARARRPRTVLVEDEDIREAQRVLWERLRLIVEPGAAAALAALRSGRYVPVKGERVGVVLCGGNAALPAEDFASEAGRKASAR